MIPIILVTGFSSLLAQKNSVYTSLEDALNHKDSVYILNLSNKNLKVIPYEIGELENLLRLDLSYNQLTSLPSFFGVYFKNLAGLDLSHNRISNLPESMRRMAKLQWISLAHNQIKQPDLSEELWTLENLTSLDLSNNLLDSIPEKIGQLKKLKYLDFSDNRIKKIPQTIGYLDELWWLRLDNNKLTSLPDSLGSMKKLRRLNLNDQNGNLLSLPESLSQIRYLEITLSKSQKKALKLSIKAIKRKNRKFKVNYVNDLPTKAKLH